MNEDQKSQRLDSAMELAKEVGFESIGFCDASKIEVRPEVRDMCANCRVYDTSWACPPACGDIEYFTEFVASFDKCVVVQTIGDVEDSFDIEAMLNIEKEHSERVYEYLHKLTDKVEGSKVLSAGTCKLCDECSYPDNPCLFPEKRLVSVEAAGIVVNDLCKLANLDYNYGAGKLAYTSCALI